MEIEGWSGASERFLVSSVNLAGSGRKIGDFSGGSYFSLLKLRVITRFRMGGVGKREHVCLSRGDKGDRKMAFRALGVAESASGQEL